MAKKTKKKSKRIERYTEPPKAMTDAPGAIPSAEVQNGQKTDAAADTVKVRSGRQRFSFPTVVRCPRCRGLQTRAYSTQGKVQYRKCLAPICQYSFSVRGEKV